MPDVNLSPIDAQQAAINRRRLLAQALQQMSMQQIEQPQVAGAKISPWQGVAKLAQALSGSIGNSQADQQQSALSNQYQQQRTGQAAGLVDSAIPQPEGNSVSLPVPQMQEAQIPGENAVPAQSAPDVRQSVTLPVTDKQKTARQRLVEVLSAGITSQDPSLRELSMNQIQDIQKTGAEGEAFKREMAKQLASQQFTAQQAGLNRDLTREDVMLGHGDKQAELAQALTLANRPKPFTANAGDQFGQFDPTTGQATVQGTVPQKQTVQTEFDQKLAAFNADPVLTKQYGAGLVGMSKFDNDQKIQTDVAIEKAKAAASKTDDPRLANVDKSAILPALADYQKTEAAYNAAQKAQDDMNSVVASAKAGNKVSAAYSPVLGVLEINTANGTKRINRNEIEMYAGAGSAFDRIAGWVGKGVSGQPIPANILADMKGLSDTLAANSKTLHDRDLQSIDKVYRSTFAPKATDINSALDKVFGAAPAKQ